MVMHNYANLRGLLLPEIEISYLIGSFNAVFVQFSLARIGAGFGSA